MSDSRGRSPARLKWVVTGGCGFVGSALVRALLERNLACGLRVVDDLSTGSIETLTDLGLNEDSEVILPWSDNHGIAQRQLLRGDIREDKLARSVCQGADVVVHLAANTGVQPSIDFPLVDAAVNIGGTMNYLEAARREGVRRYIFASSGAPTGNVDPPIHEDLVCRPMSPYGASKLAGEAYCSAYYWAFGLETIALRFSNVYGPGSGHKTSVVARFVKDALEGRDWTIFGDGRQTRDFLYIGDLIDAVILAADKGRGGEIYQIATGRETSINELTELLRTLLKEEISVSPSVIFEEARTGDMKRNYADNAKARRDLEWEPVHGLDQGLRETLHWFLKNTGSSVASSCQRR